MRKFLFTPEVNGVAIQGSDELFPARRVYCVGRNYADHAREMGHDPDREPPFFFMKHPDSLLPSGQDMPYPPGTQDVHHELEMVVALKSGGREIEISHALDHVYGYAVGLDMTRRDLQAHAKKNGHPWATAKAFDHAAPISPIAQAAQVGHPAQGAIELMVNGKTRQSGDLAQMIWSVPEIIAYLSRLFELKAGDLIYTGTPAGVGPIQKGDRLEGQIAGVGRLSTKIV
ncbi:MAG: fumarylacetoacetate hydrolase family protein [Limnobacter sp.]|nr:fumarylacetoacetate hydrolase family protein [Limnobacter sp.]